MHFFRKLFKCSFSLRGSGRELSLNMEPAGDSDDAGAGQNLQNHSYKFSTPIITHKSY